MAFSLLNAFQLERQVQNELVMVPASRSISHGGLNDVTCHVRMQYISNRRNMLLNLQA